VYFVAEDDEVVHSDVFMHLIQGNDIFEHEMLAQHQQVCLIYGASHTNDLRGATQQFFGYFRPSLHEVQDDEIGHLINALGIDEMMQFP
jgi:hypothetical protein